MMHFSTRLYRLLLRLYPAQHRREYGDLMVQAFRDLAREAYGQRGLIGLLLLWPGLLVDTFRAAYNEHRRTRKHAMKHLSYSKTHLLVVFLPLIIMTAYLYLVRDYHDIALFYVIILLAGIIAWIWQRLGFIASNPILGIYTAGILIGLMSVIVFIGSSFIGTTIYWWGLPYFLIGVVPVLIYIVAVRVLARLAHPFSRQFHIVGSVLLLTTIANVLINPTYMGNQGELASIVRLHYITMHALTTLCVAIVGIGLVRHYGRAGLPVVTIVLGIILLIADPGYYTGDTAKWIDLSLVLFPLIICPAWWWLTPSSKVQVRGMLMFWTMLMGIVAIAPSIARVSLQLPYESPGVWLSRILVVLPCWFALWLALRTVEADAQTGTRQEVEISLPANGFTASET
jgi:hypothetical protein